jgi:DNA-binding MltR family transcriptional regulator
MPKNTMPIAPLTQADILQMMHRQADAGDALVLSGLIDDELQKLLLAAGRSISNKTAKIIFDDRGPLSTFSAKIEVAYMFELIDEPVRNDLRIIKSIRNAFAHTTRWVDFHSPRIATQVWKLSNWTQDREPKDCFVDRVRECVNAITEKLDVLILANAVRDYPSIDRGDD